MDEQQRYLLLAHRKDLGDDLRSEDVFTYLQSKFILDIDDVEIIKGEKTSRRKVEKLLDILADKGRAAFVHFHNALMDSEYVHLAELLREGIDGQQKNCLGNGTENIASVETILRDGGVPQRPSVFAERPEAARDLKRALYMLRSQDGWIILHGMVGSGKTVLAAEVLRDETLVRECFPGGIFWVNIGLVDPSKLLMKVQNLCAWLDSDKMHPVPRNLEEARDRIRVLLPHQHPRSLLVLDDLWTANDARYFEVRARILVTTRDSSVASYIGGLVQKVQIKEGFTAAQCKSVLSKWTGIRTLPPEADGIIAECKGSPLAISMLGALLKGHSNRWTYYLNQLKESKLSKIKSKMAYQYPTLCEAISMSVENLPDLLKEKYQHFAVFDEDTRVPVQVLSLLWDEDEIEVEDTMDELVARSLARRHHPSADIAYESYSVHDLQLDYLRERCSHTTMSKTLKELHQNLIDKYLEHCNGDFASLKDDSYIHWNLIEHLIEADIIDKAVELLVNFKWMESKLRVTGSPNLISNYRTVIVKITDKKKQKVLEEFRHFVSVNAYLLSVPGHQQQDLIQLALAQAFSPEVYNKAMNEAKALAKEGKLYFNWCNKPKESMDNCLLTVRHHTGPVYSCQFSFEDSTKHMIVSGGGDGKIKVWDWCNGKELMSLEGHKDTVHCCRFSPNGKRIVSASADRTVKVWSVESRQEMLTMKSHTGDVYCCTFSPDGTLIVSCSDDETIKVWDAETGFLLKTLTGHSNTVNWCCFSPNGDRIASASNDLTVKVWESSSGALLFTCGGDKDFVSFCTYNPTGDMILATSLNYLQFFRSKDGSLVRFITTSCPLLSIAFSPDGKFAAGSHADTTVQLWDLQSECCIGIYRGHSGWVHSVSFAPDGKRVVTASADETCKVWEVKQTDECTVKLRKMFDVVYNIDDEPMVIVADSSHCVQILCGLSGQLTNKSESLKVRVTMLKVAPGKDFFCVGCQNGDIVMLKIANCRQLKLLKGHTAAVTDGAFGAESNRLVTSSEDNSLLIWNMENGERLARCEGHTASVTKCVLFSDDRLVASSSFDGYLRIWDITSGNCLLACQHDKNSLLSCAVSPNNSIAISTSAGGTAKLWNTQTGALMYTLSDHMDCVRCARFSPNSNLVATGSDDGTIKLWDTKTGEELATCERHGVWITDVQFSHEGHTVVSVSNDMKWWTLDGGLIQTFRIRGSYLRQVKVSEDFQTFTTIDDSGQLYILNAIASSD